MLTPRLAVLALLVLLITIGCVQPGSPGSGSAKSPVLFKISNREITAEQFISSPPIRNAMRQFILFDEMKAECAKRGIKADQAEIEKQLADTKQGITLRGQSWEEYLKENGTTEEEYREMLSGPLLFQALSKQLSEVTDEDVKKAWADEAERKRYSDGFAADNHLPDSDKAKLSLEDEKLHAYVKADLEQKKASGTQDDLIQNIVDQTTLDLDTCVRDPKKAQQFEDLILNNSKTKKDEKGEEEGVVLNPEGANSQEGGGKDEPGGSAEQPSGDAERPGDADKAGDATKPNEGEKDGGETKESGEGSGAGR
jgi:hypothetical protein